MSDSSSTANELSDSITAIDLSTPSKSLLNGPIFSSQPPCDQQRDKLPKYFNAEFLSKQPFFQTIDHVRHRIRGILITQDSYRDFQHSFSSDMDARKFLGDLLIAMSHSKNFLRMSELELEEMNASWDDEIRPSYSPGPTEMEVTVAYEVVYQVSARPELVKTIYYIALTSSFMSDLAATAICRRELNGVYNGSTEAKRVKMLPFSRHSQQRESAEEELKLAIDSCCTKATTQATSVSKLVEYLIIMTKIGRRERSDTFLIIAESQIPRFLPREKFANFSKCVKFVYWDNSATTNAGTDSCHPDNRTHRLRGLIIRRPIGDIDINEMDSALVAALKASTHLKSVLECDTSKLAIDRVGCALLQCRGGSETELFQTTRTMFQ